LLTSAPDEPGFVSIQDETVSFADQLSMLVPVEGMGQVAHGTGSLSKVRSG
jgi:hypothetical protein